MSRITIKRFNGSEGPMISPTIKEVEGPLFIGPCLITSEEDVLFCAIRGVDYHIFISDKNGEGKTEIY